ncbi:MAG: hypothetical protein AAGF59_13745, partial [Pseudomonadota bacterium]
MSNQDRKSAFGTNELFRYVRIVSPSIIDLETRARQDPFLSELVEKDPLEQEKWAESFLESSGSEPGPTAAASTDGEAAVEESTPGNRERSGTHLHTLKLALAHTILGNEKAADHATKVLCALEEDNPDTEARTARPILRRFKPKSVSEAKAEDDEGSNDAERIDALKKVQADVAVLWQARNEQMRSHQEEISKLRREIVAGRARIIEPQNREESDPDTVRQDLKQRITDSRSAL